MQECKHDDFVFHNLKSCSEVFKLLIFYHLLQEPCHLRAFKGVGALEHRMNWTYM